jgi:hypothetical protein
MTALARSLVPLIVVMSACAHEPAAAPARADAPERTDAPPLAPYKIVLVGDSTTRRTAAGAARSARTTSSGA